MRSGVIPTRRWRRRRCVTADTRNLWGRIVFQKPANGRQSDEGRPRAAVRLPARVRLGHEPQVVEGDDETPCDAAIPHTTRGARAYRRLPSHRWRTGDVPPPRCVVRRVGVLMGGRDESYLEFVEYDHGKQITKRFRVKHSDYADSREVQHEGEDIGDVKWY